MSDHFMEDPMQYYCITDMYIGRRNPVHVFNRSIASFTSPISIYYFSIYDDSMLQFLP